MIVHGESSAGPVHAVAAHLASEYAGTVPPGLVESVVRDAERDLRGQVVPGSLGEMLHHLAAFRLQELREDLLTTGGAGSAVRTASSPA